MHIHMIIQRSIQFRTKC